MKIGVNCGHTKSGAGSGAVGFINESVETRNVGYAFMNLLKANGHTVVDCTIDKVSSQSVYLLQAVNIANRQDLDYFISIHFNAGKGKGVEVYTYKGRQFTDALEVCQNISALGFDNRGVKDGTGLYVVRKTKAKSMLIEVCFVDSDDANKYLALGANKIAEAIYKAIADTNVVVKPSASKPTTNASANSVQKTSSKNSIVALGQQHSINFTGVSIAVDGIRGTNTKKNGIRCVQHAMNLDYNSGLKEDGYFGIKSDKEFGNHYVEKGETQYMVTALEILLMLRGYDPKGVECPGEFGSGLEAAVYQYQLDNDLKSDKIAGPKVFKSLMGV